MKSKIILHQFILLLFLISGSYSQEKLLPYQNPNLSVEERVKDLVSRMTIDEKIGQMEYNAPEIEHLGIPAYNWWNEALHGVARNGLATVFPQSIGLAATWDTDLMYHVASVISTEGRAKYNDAVSKNERGIYQGITFWSPNVNIFRDPRWGRGMETYGEDPYLTGQIGLQFVEGMQGDNPRYLKTVATAKHYAVHSGPEPERHRFDAEVSEYDLRETYLPQFKTLVQDANVQSVMCAYNSYRGDPCCGSNLLLKNILRNEWGFKGYVVSDCGAIADIYEHHKFVKTSEEASSIAVKSGTDLNCGEAFSSLTKAFKDGLITENEIDTAVTRLFTARFKLGMFDPPDMVPFSKLGLKDVDTKANKRAALEATRESIVLLKNENNLLPLKKRLGTVAVLGPNANDVEVLLGNYNGFPSAPVTPFHGIQQKLFNTKVIYERGCNLVDNMPDVQIIPDSVLFTSGNKNKEKGLTAEYFDNSELTGKPVFTRVDYDINFSWRDESPDPKLNPENFGIRWSGVIIPPRTGKYEIGIKSFSDYRIFINDSLLIGFVNMRHPFQVVKPIELQAGKEYKIKIEFYNSFRFSFIQLLWSVPDKEMEKRAIELAKKADVVIMVMGISARLEGEEMQVNIEGFRGGDRLSMNLPEVQENLIKKVMALNKPVVLVLLNGSALSINWEDKNIPSIIEAWYPGQAAGDAIADVIFGDYNPGGKLPVTFYKSVDQLPPFTDYSMIDRTYRYFKGEPLYPFGYGLSYTTFEFKNLKLIKSSINKGESTSVLIDVTNTGKIPGDEVVQLYVKAEKDNRAIKSLKGFKRISLNPNETKIVEFEITPKTLSRWIDGKGFSVESDKYILLIGSSSRIKDLKQIILNVE